MAIKFRDEQIKTEVIVAREIVKDVVSGDIELKGHGSGSQVNEVLDVKARVKDVKAVIVEGGVEINGVIQIDCLYNVEEVVEDRDKHGIGTYHQDARIEFENFIDIPEAEPGMRVFLNIRVAEITYEVLETDVLEVAVTLIKYCSVGDVREIKCVTQVNGLSREEVTEEQIRIEEWIGDECIRTSVVKEVDLKDHCPDIENVLAVVGEIAKTEYRTLDHAVASEGVLEVSLLYMAGGNGENPQIRAVDERVEFDHTIDLYGVEAGMTVYANHKIMDFSIQMISDERVRVAAQLEIYVKVTRPRRLTVVTDIRNKMVDTERMLVNIQEVVGRNRVKDAIVHRINVPPTRPDVERLLQAYGRVKDLTSIVNDGGVVVEGSLEGTAFFAARENYIEGEMTVCLKDYFDFDSFIPVEDCEEGMEVYVETEVKRTTCQVLNDRTLEMNVLLERAVKVTRNVELECVTDLVEISPMVGVENCPTYIVYVVQRDDTLWKIARRYKVDPDGLAEFNDLENPAELEVGQKIMIPKSMIGRVN